MNNLPKVIFRYCFEIFWVHLGRCFYVGFSGSTDVELFLCVNLLFLGVEFVFYLLFDMIEFVTK